MPHPISFSPDASTARSLKAAKRDARKTGHKISVSELVRRCVIYGLPQVVRGLAPVAPPDAAGADKAAASVIEGR